MRAGEWPKTFREFGWIQVTGWDYFTFFPPFLSWFSCFSFRDWLCFGFMMVKNVKMFFSSHIQLYVSNMMFQVWPENVNQFWFKQGGPLYANLSAGLVERGQWKLAGLCAYGTHCDRLIESVSGQKRVEKKWKKSPSKLNNKEMHLWLTGTVWMKPSLSTGPVSRLLQFL